MSEAKLDQLVKGAPAPENNLQSIPISNVTSAPPSTNAPLSDPLASLPSSPPQIYLNLLILEASLRVQYLELRARRRQYTFFLTLLALWNLYFGYALFLAPREDGSGVGGSVYWVIEVAEKVAFMGGIVTGMLVWGTGQWERGIRWPRRWVGVTNRGLRGFNCKIVVVKGPWWKEWFSTISFFFTHGLFFSNGGSSYRHIDSDFQSDTEKGSLNKSGSTLSNIHEDDQNSTPLAGYEEDLAPGGDTIKLLLLPKPFSPSFRENWDLYRTEYWDRENERRRALLSRLLIQDKKLRQHRPRPSLLSRFRFRARTPKDVEISSSSPHHASHHSAAAQNKHTLNSSSATHPAEKRLLRGATGGSRSGSHSRTSSRSTTPTPDLDEHHPAGTSQRTRRGSTASTSSSTSLRKKKPASTTASSGSASSGTTGQPSSGPRIQKLTSSTSSSRRATSPSPSTTASVTGSGALGTRSLLGGSGAGDHGIAGGTGSGSGRISPLGRGDRNSFSSETDGSRPVTPAFPTTERERERDRDRASLK